VKTADPVGAAGDVNVDETADDVDHLISPEERLRIAMARQ
jgi:hypothetical protein